MTRAVYGETPPMVNVTRSRGQWQSFDIVFKAPVFDGEKVVSSPRITVFQNGVLIHHNTEILGRIAHRNNIPLAPPRGQAAVSPGRSPLPGRIS